MRTFAEVAADPTSNLYRNLRHAEAVMAGNRRTIAALETTGLSTAQAWNHGLGFTLDPATLAQCERDSQAV